jgi:hypothetical protein
MQAPLELGVSSAWERFGCGPASLWTALENWSVSASEK